MKSIRIAILASFAALALQSCENNEPQHDAQKAYLHLQNWFDGDDVKIHIDGTQVYHNNSVVTNPLVSLADVDSTTQEYGNHEITVNVNNTAIHTEHFDLHQTLWLGINLQVSDSSIHILYFTEPFLYD